VKFDVKVDGLKDLEQALNDLSRSVGKGVLTRSLRKAAEPIKAAMMAYAPTGGLKDSVTASSKLARNQAKLHRRAVDQRSGVELFVGPSYELGRGGRTAHLFEFGTRERVQRTTGRRTGRLQMQPFVRPAWDGEQIEALGIIRFSLWDEVTKATERARKKAAREAAKLARG
jgi:hypothetical protein